MCKLLCSTLGLFVVAACLRSGIANESSSTVIPHNQSATPGPPLSPSEALRRMKVPPDFTAELVASEPEIVNPVAMTIDERGRFWITESLEYPRRAAGPGRDRIKILEDTDQDGAVDKVTIFADGLNIPSGIAVGYGGVWVANSPDILFLQDSDGDDRADHQEVVVTGFGRDDTHELPNSLTWGPDGWLYGLNGVFNRSRVTHQGQTFDFTCALFRIHPRTHRFELFAEGTSNPWGVAFDPEGSAFVSACVIDHLWHLTETGYYHRQGGPYPPYTWKLGSIVQHKHQMAAYCGITYFDSDAYPEEYRDRLYMGNIHGGCINVDVLSRDGATYFARPAPDFLTANDVWFMPVVQKTGPDGCLYVLDWYDRYHCYQDANRDPKGIDRGRGRLYRIRYRETPRAEPFDLSKETDAQLIARLHSPNIYYRDLAQRLLAERSDDQVRSELRDLVLDERRPQKTRMHALWALIGGGSLDNAFHQQLLAHSDSVFRAWGVRAAGNQGRVSKGTLALIQSMATDTSPDVRLQVAIAAGKLDGIDRLETLCTILAHPAPDKLIPHIVWNNMQPVLNRRSDDFVRRLSEVETPNDGYSRMLPHVMDRLLDSPQCAKPMSQILAQLLEDERWETRDACLRKLRESLLRQRESSSTETIRQHLLPSLLRLTQEDNALRSECLLLAALLGDEASATTVRGWTESDSGASDQQQLEAFMVLAATKDQHMLTAAQMLLSQSRHEDSQQLAAVIETLGRANDPQIARLMLAEFSAFPIDVRPRVIQQLTQRNAWARMLLSHIAQEKISRDELHINQIRRLKNSSDPELARQVHDIWGTIREGRNPQVEESIEAIERLMKRKPGDAKRGTEVFHRHCGQCHQIYGRGEQVGPDITSNGRASFEQLLSNVFDPNLVIGNAYQAHQVITDDGRTLSGLLVLDTHERIVLRLQGGKEESIARADIEEHVQSPLSLMPEGWEKQLSEQELVDLMHFITLDGPPEDSNSRRLPGTPRLRTE